jgi:hypothetical protein
MYPTKISLASRIFTVEEQKRMAEDGITYAVMRITDDRTGIHICGPAEISEDGEPDLRGFGFEEDLAILYYRATGQYAPDVPWGELHHLDQQVVLENGEDIAEVARELTGTSKFLSAIPLGLLPGDQWPTIRFFSPSRHAIDILAGKASGSRPGWKKGRPRS